MQLQLGRQRAIRRRTQSGSPAPVKAPTLGVRRAETLLSVNAQLCRLVAQPEIPRRTLLVTPKRLLSKCEQVLVGPQRRLLSLLRDPSALIRRARMDAPVSYKPGLRNLRR